MRATLPPMENTPPPPIASQPVETSEDKTVAIVAYLTIIGFIIALIMHGNKKTRLGAFHLRQALGLVLATVAIGLSVTVLGWVPLVGWLLVLLAPVLWLGLFVLWVLGLIAAINGQFKPMPLLGEYFHRWFATTFD